MKGIVDFFSFTAVAFISNISVFVVFILNLFKLKQVKQQNEKLRIEIEQLKRDNRIEIPSAELIERYSKKSDLSNRRFLGLTSALLVLCTLGTATLFFSGQQAVPEGDRMLITSIKSLSQNNEILFEENQTTLSESTKKTLEEKAELMKKHPGIKITLEGFSSSAISPEENMAWGQKRAQKVKEYFVKLGIDPARIQVGSYGKSQVQINTMQARVEDTVTITGITFTPPRDKKAI